ncbi:MAG TPA: hypothetical protein VGG64_04320, partial [Pirellulales bacterium]
MAENEKKSHWSDLAQELGTPVPAAESKRPAIVPPAKAAERKRAEAPTPPAKPKSTWSDVAAMLGISAPARAKAAVQFKAAVQSQPAIP